MKIPLAFYDDWGLSLSSNREPFSTVVNIGYSGLCNVSAD